MIKYSDTKVGDILKVTDEEAHTYGFQNGELCRVLEVHEQSCLVENRDGKRVEYVSTAGLEGLSQPNGEMIFHTLKAVEK